MTAAPMTPLITGNLPVQILQKIPFIDAVSLLLKEPLDLEDLETLRQSCGKIGYGQAPPDEAFGYPYRLQVYQPSDFALSYLDERHRQNLLINGIEFALDLITINAADAGKLQRFIDKRLVQKWRRRRKIGGYKDTFYGSEKRHVTRQIVSYATKGSKVAGGAPCAHFELRFHTPRSIRRVAPNGLADLIDFDHRALWVRCNDFVEVDRKKLGAIARHARGDKRRRTPDRNRNRRWKISPDADTAEGAVLVRLARQFGGDGEPKRPSITSQEILDAYRGEFDLRPAKKHISRDWWLPEPPTPTPIVIT